MPVKRSSVTIIGKDFVPVTVEDVFLKFRADLIADLRQSLIDAERDQPGKLLQSIDLKNTTFSITTEKAEFKFSMEEYWKFVDKGVDGWKKSVGSEYKYKRNGKRIPLDAMLKVISTHGLVPKSVQKKNKRVNKKLGSNVIEKARISYGWAIGAVIKRDGVKPTHFFTNVVNEELKERLTAELTKALQKDIEITFTV